MIVVLGVACRDSADEGRTLLEERSRRGFIAFVGAGPNDPFWPIMRAGGQRYDENSPLEIRFLNPGQDIPQAQVDLLSSLDDPHLRGLCIRVNDREAVAPLLNLLRNRGITVVTMVEPVGPTLRLTYVGVNDVEVGGVLAQCVIDTLGGKGGTIMVLHAGNDHPVYGPRHLAFMEKIQRRSNIDVMGDFNCRADPVEARQIIKERSERYPRLDLWVTMEDWPLSDGTPPKDVFAHHGPRYITFGGLPCQWSLIQEAVCPCVVAANYGEIPARAAMLCYSGLREPSQEQRNYYVPLRVITPQNIDEYRRDWIAWASAPTTATSRSTP